MSSEETERSTMQDDIKEDSDGKEKREENSEAIGLKGINRINQVLKRQHNLA